MANIKSAKKRARQAIKRRMRNVDLKTRAYTFIKRANSVIEKGEKDKIDEAVKQAISEIDRMIPRGIFAKNKAARLKSRLNAAAKKSKAA